MLRTSAEIGYDGFEFGILDEELLPWFPEGMGIWPERLGRRERAKLKETSESYKIEMPSLSADCLWKYVLADPDRKSREKAVSVVHQIIRLASDLGASVVLLPGTDGPPNHSLPKTIQDSWKLQKESLGACLREAAEYGVTLGLENCEREFLMDADRLVKMVHELGDEHLKVYYDVSNSVEMGDDPLEEIDKIGKELCCIHSTDFLRIDERTKWNDIVEVFRKQRLEPWLEIEEKETFLNKIRTHSGVGHVPFGKGNIDWNRILRHIRETGYDWFLVDEGTNIYPKQATRMAEEAWKAYDGLVGQKMVRSE